MTVVWAAGPDHPGTLDLPATELRRISAWMASHDLDPQAVRNVAVVHAGRSAWIEAEVLVPLPTGTFGRQVRRRDLCTPPPVPWTADNPGALRRAG